MSFVLSACSSSVFKGSENDFKTDDISFVNFKQPEREPEISGVVKSIIGNTATVAIVEKQTGDNATEEVSDKNATAIGITTPTTNIPGSGSGRLNRDATISDADRLAKLLERSTGQETLTVPVGIAMTKISEGEDRERIEANLDDLNSGSMISVWLNQEIKDKKVAEFVNIR